MFGINCIAPVQSLTVPNLVLLSNLKLESVFKINNLKLGTSKVFYHSF